MSNSKKRASPSRTPTSVPSARGRTAAASTTPTNATSKHADEKPNGAAKGTHGATTGARGASAKVPVSTPPVAPSSNPTSNPTGNPTSKAPKVPAASAPAGKATPAVKGAPAGKGAKDAAPVAKAVEPASATGGKPTTLGKKVKAGVRPSSPAAPSPAAKPEPGKPRTWPKGGPGKADLKRYREALVARRRELLSSSKELAAEALQAGGGDFSVDHMADHGSDNYEQDFNLKLLEGEAGQLVDIRDALAKLDGKGDLPFGLCEGCADEPQGRCPSCPWIPATRLDAIPQARLCVQMKEREESRG